MNPNTLTMVLKLIDLVVLGVKVAPSVKAAYDEHRSKLQTMIDEGREPNQSEWDELLAAVQANTDELNA